MRMTFLHKRPMLCVEFLAIVCIVLSIVAAVSAAATSYVFIVFVLKFNIVRSYIDSNCCICISFFFLSFSRLIASLEKRPIVINFEIKNAFFFFFLFFSMRIYSIFV